MLIFSTILSEIFFGGKNPNGSKIENFDAADLIVGLLRDKILFQIFFTYIMKIF